MVNGLKLALCQSLVLLGCDKPKLCHFSLETAKWPKRHNLTNKICIFYLSDCVYMFIPYVFFGTLLENRSKGFCLSSCHGASIFHPVQRGAEPELVSHLPFCISLTLRDWKHESAFSENDNTKRWQVSIIGVCSLFCGSYLYLSSIVILLKMFCQFLSAQTFSAIRQSFGESIQEGGQQQRFSAVERFTFLHMWILGAKNWKHSKMVWNSEVTHNVPTPWQCGFKLF